MNKLKYILVLVIIFTNINSIFAIGLSLEFRGNCNSNDYVNKYVNFTYFSDSLNFVSVLPDYCNLHVIQPKHLFKPFNQFLIDDSTIINPETCSIKLIFDSTVTPTNRLIYAIEFYSDSLGKSIVLEYASPYNITNRFNTSVNLNYQITLDNDEGFASQYSSSEIDEVLVFNQNGNSLYELQDKDRNNELVGLKYYSDINNKQYIEYFKPNN